MHKGFTMWKATRIMRHTCLMIFFMHFLPILAGVSFANCELRSVVIVDRSLMGSYSSTTNYPGKIPRGPDLPSDVADEKHSEKGASK